MSGVQTGQQVKQHGHSEKPPEGRQSQPGDQREKDEVEENRAGKYLL